MRELCNKEVTFHVSVVVLLASLAVGIGIAWLFLGSDCPGTRGRIA